MFTRLLSGPIQVVIGSSLTIGLANVLGCKRTVDIPAEALLPMVLPHSRGCLRPGMLIRGDIFFFGKSTSIVSHHHREHKGAKPRSNHIE
jgi:hypothetical protein